MKKKLFSLVAASIVSTTALNADFLGVEAGVSYWNSDITGNFQKGSTSVDLENDLGYGSDNTNFFWASFEHPIPLIPNFKVQYTDISSSANGTLNKSIDFAGQTYSASTNIGSSIDLKQLDLIAYYEILDNWVNLDLGVNVKYIDGSIAVSSSTVSSKESFDVYLPMLYGKAKFDLPFTGLSAFTDLSYIGYSGSSFSDFKAAVSYESALGLGAHLGYRYEQIKIDDLDDFNSDIKIDGFYASVFYHF